MGVTYSKVAVLTANGNNVRRSAATKMQTTTGMMLSGLCTDVLLVILSEGLSPYTAAAALRTIAAELEEGAVQMDVQ
jgi:hypothetical protein